MSKNKIIVLVLSIIFIYELYMFGASMYEYYKSLRENELSNISFSFSFYLNPVIYLLNLIALLQFVISKFRRSALLRVLLQYNIFSFFIFFPIWTISSFLINDPYHPHTVNSIFMIRYGMSLLITAFSIFALHYLTSTISARLISLGDGTNTFDEVSKWQRFFQRVLDLSVITLIIYPSFDYISRFFMEFFNGSDALFSSIGYFFRSDQFLYIFIYGFITLYYLIVEGIFNTSIGKTILGNVIVNNIAEKPSIGQRIGRTFARLIPFDAFSFLFISRGWHDSLTRTYVVKAEQYSEKEAG